MRTIKSSILLTAILLVSLTAISQEEKINDNISESELKRIQAKAQNYYHRLTSLRTAPALNLAAPQAHIYFGWPLRASGDYDHIPNYYMIQNYVDDDNTSGIIEYNCGDRAYNGHNGTDINIWPFWWHIMNNSYVQVVAAAPGIVIDVLDSYNNDDNCGCTGNINNNIITVLHADSTLSMYYHIKDNSALVEEDDEVYQGQPIASVGSSGCSSNPHLHFEVRDKTNTLIDPWVGANPAADCNNRNEDSWWQNQKPYWEPQVNRVMTHSSTPALQGFNGSSNFCPASESVNAQNNFAPGNTVYLGIAMHDYLDNTSVSFQVQNPVGSVVFSSNHTNSQGENISRWYLLYNFTLPSNASAGTYHVVVTYQGVSYFHQFAVNCISDYNLTGTLAGSRGYIASNSITATAIFPNGSKAKLQAANYIQFNPGFTATAGTTLKASIRNCNYTE